MASKLWRMFCTAGLGLILTIIIVDIVLGAILYGIQGNWMFKEHQSLTDCVHYVFSLEITLSPSTEILTDAGKWMSMLVFFLSFAIPSIVVRMLTSINDHHKIGMH
jgi:hypothetical protein